MIIVFVNQSLTSLQVEKICDLLHSHTLNLVGSEKYIPKELKDFYIDYLSLSVEDCTQVLLLESDINLYNKEFAKFLSNLFSVQSFSLAWLKKDGVITNDLEVKRPDTLFVFPGPIVPLTMGSHQRSFNLLFNLTASGKVVDVLIPDNPKLDKGKIKDSLKCVCREVYFYKDRRKKFTKIQDIKRGIEKKFRALMGKSVELPDFFSERLQKKPTESLKRWVNNLYIAYQYEDIIVSYAWMLPAVNYISHMRDKFRLICDTHDVQFYRNQNVLNRKERLFFNQKKEKSLEIDILNQCDSVIAISEMDAKILSENLCTKVVPVYPGFDYSETLVKQRPVGRPIHFGFIGGGMEANVQSLAFVIKTWWSVIKQHSPDSRLYIAGSICNNPIIREQSFFDRNIVLMGFVKNVNDFYNCIEVALNPVVVTGGLNFKSVEAVCAGKHLFTNDIGVKCLTSDFPCTVIRHSTQIIDAMNQIEFNLKQDKQNRIKNQKKALQIFGNAQTKNILLKNLLV